MTEKHSKTQVITTAEQPTDSCKLRLDHGDNWARLLWLLLALVLVVGFQYEVARPSNNALCRLLDKMKVTLTCKTFFGSFLQVLCIAFCLDGWYTMMRQQWIQIRNQTSNKNKVHFIVVTPSAYSDLKMTMSNYRGIPTKVQAKFEKELENIRSDYKSQFSLQGGDQFRKLRLPKRTENNQACVCAYEIVDGKRKYFFKGVTVLSWHSYTALGDSDEKFTWE